MQNACCICSCSATCVSSKDASGKAGKLISKVKDNSQVRKFQEGKRSHSRVTEQSFNQRKKNNIVGRITTVESIESRFEKAKEHLSASIISLKFMF